MERGRQRSCRRELSWPDFCRLALQEARSPASPRAVLSSHPIGENDRTPPDRLLCPSLLTETAVLTILCTQESLRLGSIVIGALALASTVFAQPREGAIPEGTIVQVRTNQTIDSTNAAPGHVFTGL